MTNTTVKSRSTKIDKTKAGGKIEPRSKTSATTKKARLISLLSRRTGADTASISKKFGWQSHTTRAALSRLRKAGYQISGIKQAKGKPTKYRITSAPVEQGAQ